MKKIEFSFSIIYQGLGVGGFEPIDIPNDGRFVVTTTRSHFNDVVKNALDAMKPTEILRVGGAGYKVLQVGVLTFKVFDITKICHLYTVTRRKCSCLCFC